MGPPRPAIIYYYFNFKKIYFYFMHMAVSLACMSVLRVLQCAEPRLHMILWNWSYRFTDGCESRYVFRSSGRVASR